MGFYWVEKLRRPNGAPRVYFRIRPKPEIFRVSEPENPRVKIKNQTRNPQTQNPRISAPNPPRCHPYLGVKFCQFCHWSPVKATTTQLVCATATIINCKFIQNLAIPQLHPLLPLSHSCSASYRLRYHVLPICYVCLFDIVHVEIASVGTTIRPVFLCLIILV